MSEMNENKTWSRIWGIDPNYTEDRDAQAKERALEIIDRHRIGAQKDEYPRDEQVACQCSGVWRTWDDYYDHLAEMLIPVVEK